ncbi:hypothetical protein L0Z08_29360 [Burkholderia multivorans]|nr:hypothetical protein [Burkholderia multivorans]MCO1445305.1 hypothetical protein [Burkholderia multivorans]
MTDLDDLKAQVERLPKLEEQLRGFDELGIKEKLANTSLLAREREIAKTASESVQGFRDAIANLRDSLPDLAFINDEALDGLPDAAQLLAMRTTLDGIKQSLTTHLAAMQALLDDGAEQFATQQERGSRPLRSMMPCWKRRLGRCLQLLERAGRRSVRPTSGYDRDRAHQADEIASIYP